MHATGTLSAEADDDATDDDASPSFLEWFLESFVKIIGYASAVYEAYPSTCVAILQCCAILACLAIAMFCCNRVPLTDDRQSSVQVRIGNGLTVDVRTSGRDRAAVQPARDARPGTQVRGARPKTATRPKVEEDDERAQSPGAHDAPSSSSGVPGSSSDKPRGKDRAPGEHSAGSTEIPNARQVPRHRAPPPQHEDGVWISTSQGYAFHKIGCGKLNQSTGVTEVTRAVAIEKGYRACRICKP